MSDLDTQALALPAVDQDGGELAAVDLVQHGLAGDAECGCGLVQGQPAGGAWGEILSRRAWSTRICQGAAGVSCSPVMNPSRSHR